jgi:EAL domain-containing protein (putative c-di-GMP-specific phosphodiesterase class I)
LHKLTVAEFVEDAETLKMVRQIGVDYAQGYYIGQPQPHILQSPKFIPAADRIGNTD